MKSLFFKFLTFVFCAFCLISISTDNVAYADNSQGNADNAKMIAKAPQHTLNDFKNAFSQPTKKIESSVRKFFTYCMIFNIIFMGFKLLFGEHNFQHFCTELIKFIMICGLFFTVLLYLKDIPDLLASTTEIGLGETLQNGSTLAKMEDLIGDIAFLYTEWFDKTSSFDVGGIIINGFLFVCAIVVLLAIMIQYVLLYLSAYFIVVCGTFALALGGISVNNDLAMGYLRKMASIAIEFLALGLMMSITVGLVKNYVSQTQGGASVLSLLSLKTDYFNNSANLFFFVVEIVIIGVLTMSIPGKVASLIGGGGSNGSPIGAMTVAAAMTGAYSKIMGTKLTGASSSTIGDVVASSARTTATLGATAATSTAKAGITAAKKGSELAQKGSIAVGVKAKMGLDSLSQKLQEFTAKRNSEKVTK